MYFYITVQDFNGRWQNIRSRKVHTFMLTSEAGTGHMAVKFVSNIYVVCEVF